MYEDLLIKYIGMILVIFLLTTLYGKATPFHTLSVSLLTAVAVGYLVVFCVGAIYQNVLLVFQGQPLTIVGVIIGSMLLFRFIPRYSVLSRIPIAFSAGTMLGLSFRTVVFTEIIGFTTSAVKPLFTPTGDWFVNFNNISTVVLTATILCVFIYTFPTMYKGPVKGIGKLGELFLYGALGAYCTNAFISNMNAALATIGQYLTTTSDMAIFFSIAIITFIAMIALDKRGILEKYSI
jgi:hypothetical protein